MADTGFSGGLLRLPNVVSAVDLKFGFRIGRDSLRKFAPLIRRQLGVHSVSRHGGRLLEPTIG